MSQFPQLEHYKGEFQNNGEIFHLMLIEKTMKISFFEETKKAFDFIAQQKGVRCVIVSSTQKHFTTGLNVMDAAPFFQKVQDTENDTGRNGIMVSQVMKTWQEGISALHECQVPVIVAVDSYCIGGGIDFITSGDIRVCTKNSQFTIKEIDIGMCADVGTVQRMPVVCSNDSKIRELMYTGRYFSSEEAKEIGLVSHIYKDKEEMMQKVQEMAQQIASKSPVAIWTIKNVMNHQQKQHVDQNLRYMQGINTAMIQTKDMQISMMAGLQKQKPVFPKL